MLYEVDWAEDGTYRPGEFYSQKNSSTTVWRIVKSLIFNWAILVRQRLVCWQTASLHLSPMVAG